MTATREQIGKSGGLSSSQQALLNKWLKNKKAAPAGIARVSRDGELPLSFSQQRLWFLDQFDHETPAYNLPLAFRLHGSLDVSALERSLNEIVHRHEPLRTTFHSVQGRPVQAIAPTAEIPFERIDVTTVDESVREAEAMRVCAQETLRLFDLEQEPLMRATLIRLDTHDHILLLTLHHIAADGWSLAILTRELAALYRAFVSGQPSPLADLPVQYVDIANWQRQVLKGSELESQIEYWRQQLAGTLPVLELPTDHARPAVKSNHGARYDLALSMKLSDELKQLSRREGATLFMTLLAAFDALLYRYTGQTDLIVGTPIAGRNRIEAENLVGLFINTLAMRVSLTNDPTFRELLARTRETALNAYANQEVPFEMLVQELQPERDQSHDPVFQVLFALQNTPPPSLDLPGIQSARIPIDNGTSKFDLTLEILEQGGALSASFEYNSDLFERESIARLAAHWQTLLAGIVEHPEQHISQLPLLAPAEEQQLLVDWNRTATDFPNTTVHELISAHALRSPKSVAVQFEDQKLTYAELDSQANQLAHYLQELGVGPDSIVGLCMERSIEMIVGMLGVLKAGGAYLPLDPAYPPERLAFMLSDAQVNVVVTQERLHDLPALASVHRVCVDADWPLIAKRSALALASQVGPDNTAFLIYTSGSTGTPKAAQLPHRGAVNAILWLGQALAVTEQDAVLGISTISFDAGTMEILLALLMGARLHLVGRKVALDAGALAGVLNRVTIAFATPATWRMLIDTGWKGNLKLTALSGGEALPGDLAQMILRRVAALWNLYGPAEATIFSSAYRVTAGDKVAPIGRPISNTQFYVLDAARKPVPIGVPGELYIGGIGIGRGYLNRPELTAERFIANPFANDGERIWQDTSSVPSTSSGQARRPSSRLYKTGDIVRYRPDGMVEYLGRGDHQVKLRGMRVELDEIRATLAQHPAVSEALVVVREDRPGIKQLVAYLTVRPRALLNIADLRAWLRAKLPEHMVPSAFVQLVQFPLTPNGKIDRQALPAPDATREGRAHEAVQAENPVEAELVRVWAELLNVESVGVTDNFFHLGGYSLLAVRLFAEIERRMGRKLPIATLFEAPTIRELARVLMVKENATLQGSLVPIQPRGTRPPIFFVHAIGGDILGYVTLAQHLGPDQPVYALRARGLDRSHAPDERVQDMAANYVQEILAVQPDGPYLLGGYSFGGMIAFEMAQQLVTMGKKVELLAIIDMMLPRYLDTFNWSFSSIVGVLQNLPYWLRDDLLRGTPKEILHRLSRKVKHARVPRGKEDKSEESALYLELEEVTDVAEIPQYYREVWEANYVAMHRYEPRPYPGRITLLRLYAQPLFSIHEPTLGWESYAECGVDVRMISGWHQKILVEPHVQSLAHHLSQILESAQVDSPNPERCPHTLRAVDSAA